MLSRGDMAFSSPTLAKTAQGWGTPILGVAGKIKTYGIAQLKPESGLGGPRDLTKKPSKKVGWSR